MNFVAITMKKDTTEKNAPKSVRGRPRQFDRASALRAAMAIFLERGYEGTSVADLVTAMEIAPPSLYAAFGSKENLFREVLALFLEERGQFVTRALQEEMTAESLVKRILHDAATLFTPAGEETAGCLVSASMVACGPENLSIASHLKELRLAPIAAIIQRFEQAKKAGQLPKAVNCLALARFYAAVVTGMAVQARDGATRRELFDVADNAMRAWPG